MEGVLLTVGRLPCKRGGIMPVPEISRPMEDGELLEMTRDETKFFIIGMLMPIRIGVGLFGSLLEYRHYPPRNSKE